MSKNQNNPNPELTKNIDNKWDITLDEIRLEHIPIVTEVLETAFGASVNRAEEMERLLRLQPDGWYFARQNEDFLGMGGAILYDTYAYIGMMAVFPQHRRKGVGRRVFEHVLDWIEKKGCPLALLDATEAGAALYSQYGFTEIDQARVYTCHPTGAVVAEDGSISLLTQAEIPELAAFDRPIFGADRARVFITYLAYYPDRFLIRRDEEGKICGFLLAMPQRLGPWCAKSKPDAEALLRGALSFQPAGEINVIVPLANSSADAMLVEYGFHYEHSLPHMAHGSLPTPCSRDLIYGQTSFAIG